MRVAAGGSEIEPADARRSEARERKAALIECGKGSSRYLGRFEKVVGCPTSRSRLLDTGVIRFQKVEGIVGLQR